MILVVVEMNGRFINRIIVRGGAGCWWNLIVAVSEVCGGCASDGWKGPSPLLDYHDLDNGIAR